MELTQSPVVDCFALTYSCFIYEIEAALCLDTEGSAPGYRHYHNEVVTIFCCRPDRSAYSNNQDTMFTLLASRKFLHLSPKSIIAFL